ncbi:CopG family transcriptional regulator [Candidatus Pacearchaeota archaeon]|nr:CopG family transcriptional regulator [Candidatus Pacearchaeota archaeon]
MNNLVSFQIDKEFLKRLDKIAKNESRSRSNVIKIAIKEFLEKNGKSK